MSTFLDHDIVCFVFAPIVTRALLRRHLHPVPFLIALAIASDKGAAATLVGNPQDMMIGQVADVTTAPNACVPALANSFGGCLLLIGSVSNLIVVQQAREIGVDISFRTFARLGIPVTLLALTALLGWVWLTR